ncbi:unnamed protein product [Calypogeia fissa]
MIFKGRVLMAGLTGLQRSYLHRTSSWSQGGITNVNNACSYMASQCPKCQRELFWAYAGAHVHLASRLFLTVLLKRHVVDST